MAWENMKFKGKSVWVEVQEENSQNPIIKSGMISLRYSNDENAKIYRGSVHNLDDYKVQKEESTKQIKKTTKTSNLRLYSAVFIDCSAPCPSDLVEVNIPKNVL